MRQEYWIENPECRSHPSGQHYYWLGSKLAQFAEEENSDIAWLQKGYATAVPIHINQLTDQEHIHYHKQTFEEFMNLEFVNN